MKIINNSNLVCNFFTAKHYWSRFWSRWENLDRFQYRFELGKFQPIRWQELLNSPAHELRNRHVVLYFFSALERAEFSLRSSCLLSFSRQRLKRAKMQVCKKLGRIGEWVSEKVEGKGREERNRLQWIPNILLSSVRPRTGSNSVIWLVISPSIKIWHQKFVFYA